MGNIPFLLRTLSNVGFMICKWETSMYSKIKSKQNQHAYELKRRNSF